MLTRSAGQISFNFVDSRVPLKYTQSGDTASLRACNALVKKMPVLMWMDNMEKSDISDVTQHDDTVKPMFSDVIWMPCM